MYFDPSGITKCVCIYIYINIHIHVIFDIWFLIFDIWFMTFDIWFMIFHWYTVYDVWYMIYDIRYLSQSGTPAIHIKTCCVVWWFESTTLSSTNIAHLPTRKFILQTFHRRRCVDHFDGRVHQKRSRIHGPPSMHHKVKVAEPLDGRAVTGWAWLFCWMIGCTTPIV